MNGIFDLVLLDRVETELVFDLSLVEFIFGDQHAELRAAELSVKTVLREYIFKSSCEVHDRIVTEVVTEDIVYDLEILDVDIEDQIFSVLVDIYSLSYELEKMVLRIKTGLPVMSCFIKVFPDLELLFGIVFYAKIKTGDPALLIYNIPVFEKVILDTVAGAGTVLLGPVAAPGL